MADWGASPEVLMVLGVMFLFLAFASLFVINLQRLRPERDYAELSLRIRSWWVMIGLFSFAVLASETTAMIFFAFVSFVALKEFFSIIPTRRVDRTVLFWAYLTIPLQYYWIATDWYGMFIIFIPVYAFLFLPMRMVLAGEPKNFLRAAGTLNWGLMLTVFCISHIAYLLQLQTETSEGIGAVGLVLYLFILTEGNDVAQYIWGKSFGKRKIVPTVSPNKTVEGFVGGVLTTTVLSVLIAPLLTPLSLTHSVLLGLIIAVAGFIGDVTLSALKRDLGVKDSSNFIPGHGGMLDRIDSLIYTAPLCLHFFRYFYSTA